MNTYIPKLSHAVTTSLLGIIFSNLDRLVIGCGFLLAWCVLVAFLQRRISDQAPPLIDCTGYLSLGMAMALGALIIVPMEALVFWWIDQR